MGLPNWVADCDAEDGQPSPGRRRVCLTAASQAVAATAAADTYFHFINNAHVRTARVLLNGPPASPSMDEPPVLGRRMMDSRTRIRCKPNFKTSWLELCQWTNSVRIENFHKWRSDWVDLWRTLRDNSSYRNWSKSIITLLQALALRLGYIIMLYL